MAPCELYVKKNFTSSSLEIIDQANEIIEDYLAQGFRLTLRQLYYQFVSRDLISNIQSEYKRIGSIINDARLAGVLDWEAIEDRTRNVIVYDHWDSPEQLVREAVSWYRIDRWEEQTYRPEVWIEKDALIGVLEQLCMKMDVPLFSCRGYTSQSEMWGASQRFSKWRLGGQTPYIIHLGDHDPSGIDMTRDIKDRTAMFMTPVEEELADRTESGEFHGVTFKLERIALNYPQIEKYAPPPNPAKLTDSRANKYVDDYGESSWELDALEPSVLADLVKKKLLSIRDEDVWKAMLRREARGRKRLEAFGEKKG